MTKPRRGDCGSCHWFEPMPDEAPNGQCFVNPPLAAPAMVPAGLGPQGPQMRQVWQGVYPPTREDRRCEKWRSYGMLPDLATERH